ncbi:MAG: hypothetical protein HEQ10_08000 [Dolichospermum sp. DEX182a]|nr:hypothetical protein [Dolichospermum sp. DEX182a]QSV64984.1 MAG: hypothetical protein HEQ26_21745 [Dolichospermum sp. DL01]
MVCRIVNKVGVRSQESGVRSSGVQESGVRSSGVRSSGVQEFRSSGVQEFRSMTNATLRYQEYGVSHASLSRIRRKKII